MNAGDTGPIYGRAWTAEEAIQLLNETINAGNTHWSNIMEITNTSNKKLFELAYPIERHVKGYRTLSKKMRYTEKVLYRLLYWTDELIIKKGDFYKGTIVTFKLGTLDAYASFYFWKKEIACELICGTKEVTFPPKQCGLKIIAGAPGSKNAGQPIPSLAAKNTWMFLMKLLSTKTTVYSGNNFVV